MRAHVRKHVRVQVDADYVLTLLSMFLFVRDALGTGQNGGQTEKARMVATQNKASARTELKLLTNEQLYRTTSRGGTCC